jgi:hypothetical protein
MKADYPCRRSLTALLMHAEIYLRFADEVAIGKLTPALPPGVGAGSVFAETYLARSADLLPAVRYAYAGTTFVYLVFTEDARSLRIHVEARQAKGALRELVRYAERVSGSFIGSARSRGIGISSAQISLYANDDRITVGQLRGFGDRFLHRFTDTIFGDVVVGILTGLLTGLMTHEWYAALVVGGASVLCFVTWLLIELRGGRDAFEYEQL